MCVSVLVFVNVRCGRLDDVNELIKNVSVGRDEVFVMAVAAMRCDI